MIYNCRKTGSFPKLSLLQRRINLIKSGKINCTIELPYDNISNISKLGVYAIEFAHQAYIIKIVNLILNLKIREDFLLFSLLKANSSFVYESSLMSVDKDI
jgi:hypothetical protein